MIRVYTKERHVKKIGRYLDSINLDHQIYTTKNIPETNEFDLGVSYCYPHKIGFRFD